MAKVYILGKMVENIKDFISMIKNMVMEHILGLMERFLLDNG